MTERLLFGPGPSLVTARVMSALARPVLGHLDPVLLGVMDDLRARLARVCRAPEGSRVFAVSGTGTSAMETAIANLVEPGKKVLVVVTGYFGLRLADIAPALRRRGADGRVRVGPRDRSGRRRIRARGLPRRRRRHRPRRDVHRRAQSRARGGRAGPRAGRAGHRRLRDLAWRPGSGHGRLGPRRRLLGRAEVPGRAVGSGADRVCAVGARAAGRVPQLLFRRGAARGLLGRPQVPPHDLLAAGLRVSRGAGGDRGRRPRGPMGAPRARCTRPLPTASSTSGSRSWCRPTSG